MLINELCFIYNQIKHTATDSEEQEIQIYLRPFKVIHNVEEKL
jgi:hypothetical protein